MKLFIYSDVHISRTSSILPVTSRHPNYTYRQDMIVQTARWMSDLIKQNSIDLIINLGDTFDQNTLTSYDIDIASEFFKMFPKNKPHLLLCGNHEMLNDKYNVLKLFNNIDGVDVIDTPTVIENLLFLPYCDYKDLDITQFNGSDYAFMHHDIYGSKIAPGRILDFGIDNNSLSKFKKVFNGHVHASSKFGNIINVGSVTTHSFADSPETYPTCYIFNTVTQELQEFKNMNCPLFRKIKVDTVQELKDYMNMYNNSGWNYVLHIESEFNIKEAVEEIVKSATFVLNYKIVTKAIKQDEDIEVEDIKLDSNLDVKKSFKDFLNTGIDLRYPMNLYNEVIDDVQTSEDVKINDKFEDTSSNIKNTLF